MQKRVSVKTVAKPGPCVLELVPDCCRAQAAGASKFHTDRNESHTDLAQDSGTIMTNLMPASICAAECTRTDREEPLRRMEILLYLY